MEFRNPNVMFMFIITKNCINYFYEKLTLLSIN